MNRFEHRAPLSLPLPLRHPRIIPLLSHVLARVVRGLLKLLRHHHRADRDATHVFGYPLLYRVSCLLYCSVNLLQSVLWYIGCTYIQNSRQLMKFNNLLRIPGTSTFHSKFDVQVSSSEDRTASRCVFATFSSVSSPWSSS